jgi:hypothetical protein
MPDGAQWVDFNFDPSPILEAGVTYWFVVDPRITEGTSVMTGFSGWNNPLSTGESTVWNTEKNTWYWSTLDQDVTFVLETCK